MESRDQRLQALASNFPMWDEQAAKREQAATNIQLGNAVANAAPTTNIRGQAQTLNAAGTQAVGATALNSQQNSLANASQMGSMAVNNMKQAASSQVDALTKQQAAASQGSSIAADFLNQKANIAQQKTMTQDELATKARVESAGQEYDNRLNSLSMKQKADIAKLGRDVKQELFDSNLVFNQDEVGRKFSNDRQLRDWSVTQSKNSVELNDRMREIEQATEKDLALREASYNKVAQLLTNEGEMRRLGITGQAKIDLANKAKEAKRLELKRKAQAGTNHLIAQGLGYVAFAAGTYFSGGNVAVGGAAMGATTALADKGLEDNNGG
jgi:hypothetical protein